MGTGRGLSPRWLGLPTQRRVLAGLLPPRLSLPRKPQTVSPRQQHRLSGTFAGSHREQHPREPRVGLCSEQPSSAVQLFGRQERRFLLGIPKRNNRTRTDPAEPGNPSCTGRPGGSLAPHGCKRCCAGRGTAPRGFNNWGASLLPGFPDSAIMSLAWKWQAPHCCKSKDVFIYLSARQD